MKSPFPGMDPYLEAYWGDVHARLIVYACDQLSEQMPGGLRVRVEEFVTILYPDDEGGGTVGKQGYYPDVRVVEHSNGGAGQPEGSGVATSVLAESLIVPLEIKTAIQRSVRVIDTTSGNRVVTALEFLSPANKTSQRGRDAYRKKQQDLLQGGVNLVEVDLIREGQYVIAAPASSVPLPYLSPYRICVIRSYRPDQAELYRVSLRERLPAIRIPLRENDPDAALALQPLIDTAYEKGHYGADIDYRVAPQPPLEAADAAWADALLREKGRR